MGKDSYDIFTHRRGYINVPTEYVPSACTRCPRLTVLLARFEPFYAFRYLPYTEQSYKVMTAAARVDIPSE